MLRRLYAHNYRCFSNFELRLDRADDGSTFLLLGKNGSGKSTIREVLTLFQRIARGTSRVGELVKRSDFHRLQTDAPLRFALEVVLSGRVLAYELALELPERFQELRVLEESLVCDGAPVFKRQQASVSVGGDAPRASTFGMDWHTVALPLIYAHDPQAQEALRMFCAWLAHMLILAPIPSQITGESSGETLQPDRAVTRLGAWFAGLTASVPAAYGDILRHAQGLMPDLEEIQNPITASGPEARTRSMTVRFRDHGAALTLPVAALSDGEKIALVCALVLASHRTHTPVLCFWDEPDSHLALDEVGHFILDLRRAFQAHSGQLIVTSHSEETIRRFSHANTFWMHRRSHMEPTQITRLEDIAGVEPQEDLITALITGEVAP